MSQVSGRGLVDDAWCKAQVAKPEWKPRQLPLEEAMKKMWENTAKAYKEHHSREPSAPYATVQEDSSLKEEPIKCSYHAHVDLGSKEAMEDVHFCEENETGAIMGVFDGHGFLYKDGPKGDVVAKMAADIFKYTFYARLNKAGGNVHAVFEEMFDDIQNVVSKEKSWSRIGTTAVVSYIDKKTNLVYTATLGDSEANVYRKFGDELKSIPLSCVRDWSSKRDALRLANFKGNLALTNALIQAEDPKQIRYPRDYLGSNVSRSLGDAELRAIDGKPGMIHKPKIGVFRLLEGDRLVLASDGLKDFVSEESIIKQVEKPLTEKTLAERLVDLATQNVKDADNVTVLVVDLQAK